MAAANLIPVTTARRYNAIPVGFVDKETLLVAMADPTNLLAVDDIKIATGLDCRAAVAPEEDIESLMGRLNTLQSAVSEAIVEGEEEQAEEDADTARSRSRLAKSGPTTRRSSSSSTASSARRWGRGPPTSTSKPTRAKCGSGSGSTACSARPRTCRAG